ncbi:flagellar protein FlgN [Erythrobacter sp. MTPC3]|uniref:flagellar protein FlgN n=1 Tax=Erythrobacter sp. MTPC3 TaxID=3056564 RepID=UPI0036F265B5
MSNRDELSVQLRQMVAVLEEERQSLAALDLDGLMVTSRSKMALCDGIDAEPADQVDEECRSLLETARQMNEVNRRVRNLLATNVAARIDALSGASAAYRLPKASNF